MQVCRIKNYASMRLCIFASKKAFTLAEVLITLGIIGLVAAMTIPAAIQRSQEQNAVVQLKKTYTTLSNAFNRAVADNGAPNGWGLISTTKNYDPVIAEKMMGYFTPYLNVIQDCGSAKANVGCFPDGTYQYRNASNVWTSWVNINTNSHDQLARVRLADGSGLAMVYPEMGGNCNYNYGPTPALQSRCGDIYVDIDGSKGPSRVGIDLFKFYLTNYGIIPAGTVPETQAKFSSACITSGGWGCTAWVLYNGNMDYTKCSTIAWGGATTCP